MQKIMKVAYLIICLSVLFFVFSCLLSIPPSYIEDARNEGVTILSALSMMPNAPAALYFRYYRCRRGHVEIFPRHLFRRH